MTQILGLQLLRGGIAWFYVSVIDLVRVKTFGQMLLETIWNNLSKNKKKKKSSENNFNKNNLFQTESKELEEKEFYVR